MKCKDIHKSYINYLEGNIEPLLKEEMIQHLDTCKSCMRVCAQVKNTYALLEEEKQTQLKPFFYTRLLQKMDNQANKKSFLDVIFFPKYKPALITAMTLITILSGIFLGNNLSHNLLLISDTPVNNQKYQIIADDYYLLESENENNIEYYLSQD